MEIKTLAELTRGEPEPNWIIKNLISEGSVTLIHAYAKTGKSSLAQSLAYAVASGAEFLGRPCKLEKVLWLAFEEHPQYLSYRHEKISPYYPGLTNDNFFYNADRGKLTAGDRWQELENTIKEHKIRLVIIDPLLEAAGIDDYLRSDDVRAALSNFSAAALRTNCSFLLLHHNNKRGRQAGSEAFESGVDRIISFSLWPKCKSGKLKVKGRIAEDNQEIRFSSNGPGHYVPDAGNNKSLKLISDYLQQHGSSTLKEVTAGTKLSRQTVKDHLYESVRSGLVVANGKKARAKLYELAA